MSSTNIFKLPIEVLTYILDFLPHSDLKDARLVCSLWYRASLDTTCSKNEVMCLEDKFEDILEPLVFHDAHGHKRERKFNHLDIGGRRFRAWKKNIEEKTTDLIWTNEKFWTKFGPDLQSLTVDSCEVVDVHFLTALTFCSKLETLIVGKYFELIRNQPIDIPVPDLKLPSLCNFILKGRVDDELCNALVKGAPKLKTVEVKAHPELSSSDQLGRNLVCTYIINKNRPLEYILNITYYAYDESFDDTVFKESQQMPYVHVMEKDSHSITSICSISRRSELKRIVFEYDSDNELNYIYENFPNLDSLTLSNGTTMGSNLSSLHIFENLSSLDLLLCKEVTDSAILRGLGTKENQKLKTLLLHARDCCLSENTIVQIMKCNPALRRLGLLQHRKSTLRRLGLLQHGKKPADFITDWSVQAIFKYQKSLEELALNGSSKLTDAGLSGVVMENDARDSHILNPTGHSLSQLKRLRTLALRNMREVTGSSFEQYFKFPAIRNVKLYNTPKLSIDGLKNLVKNNKTIEYLGVDLPCGVRNRLRYYIPADGLFQLIMANLCRLRCLEVTAFSDMIRDDIQLVEKHCGKRLEIFVEDYIDLEMERLSDSSDDENDSSIDEDE